MTDKPKSYIDDALMNHCGTGPLYSGPRPQPTGASMTDTQNNHPLGLSPKEVALSYTTKEAPLVRYGTQNSAGVPVGDGAIVGIAVEWSIVEIINEISELPDYTSPDDNPTLLMATEAELAPILRHHLAKAANRITELEAHIDELQSKVSDDDCACSFDDPGDVCAVHSPMLKKAQAEIATMQAHIAAESERMREVVRPLQRAYDKLRWSRGYSDGIPGTPEYEPTPRICNLCRTVKSRCECGDPFAAAIRAQGTSHEA